MKLLLMVVGLAMVLATNVNSEPARFDNYKVFTLKVASDEQLEQLREIEDNGRYTFWTGPNGLNDVDIMVAPHQFAEFDDLVNHLHIESVLKIDNVQT